jgi:hypothetical protein
MAIDNGEALVDLTDFVNSPSLVNPLVQIVSELHQRPDLLIEDSKLDEQIFGMTLPEYERSVTPASDYEEIRDRYPGDNVWFPSGDVVWTPYAAVRSVVHALELGTDDVMYDLGSGYGRSVLYAGATSPATCKGVELFSERVALAETGRERMELDNVEFTDGNVLDHDISDGDVFYMFLPFSMETRDKVYSRLRRIAEEKPIKVVARGGTPYINREEPWLQEIEVVDSRVPGTIPFEVVIYQSDL